MVSICIDYSVNNVCLRCIVSDNNCSLIYDFSFNRMLKDNPELYQLYKDLVVSGVITAEEFWANRGKV